MDENSKAIPEDPASQAVESICRFLTHEKIPFCLIGGFALGFYGVGRFTKDVDLKIAVSLRKWPYLEKKLQSYPKISKLKIQYISSPKIPDLLRAEWGSYPVDFLLANTAYQREVIRRARPQPFRDVTLKVASPEDLIVLKLIAARPQDLLDIDLLLKKIETLNYRYIRKWAGIWEVEKLWDRLLNQGSKIR